MNDWISLLGAGNRKDALLGPTHRYQAIELSIELIPL